MEDFTPRTGGARHIAKYVKWERVESWKDRVRVAGDRAKDGYPYAFASEDDAFLGFVGDILWLVTLPRYGGYRQAPSLVARLGIVCAAKNDGSGRFAGVDPEVSASGSNIVFADPKASQYLPLNNMFRTMLGLEFISSAPNIAHTYAKRDRSRDAKRGPYFSLAQHFRKHRFLTASSAAKLERYADAVREGRRVFLSYKRSDFPLGLDERRSWPEELSDQLTKRDITCWWDRWNLPQDDADQLGNGLLAGLLDDAVQQATWFVALVGPGYLGAGDDSWPRQEWRKAGAELGAVERRHQMRRIAVFFAERGPIDRRWHDASDIALFVGSAASPDAVAEAIAGEIDRGSGTG
jgi:hypothetical protein